MNLFYFINKNLFYRKIRTWLIMACIFMSFFSYVALKNFENLLNCSSNSSFSVDRLMTVNKINFTQPLPFSYYEKISNISGVKKATFIEWVGFFYHEPHNFILAFATEANTWLDIYQEFSIDQKSKHRFLRDKKGVLVGKEMADKQKWKIGDKIILGSNFYSKKDGNHFWEFIVQGILDSNKAEINTNFILLHYKYFNLSRSLNKNLIGWFILKTGDKNNNQWVANNIDRTFNNSFFETQTTDETMFNKFFIEQISNVKLIIESVIFSSFIMLLMVVGNIFYISVKERTQDMITMKCMGMNNKKITFIILGEAVLLVFLPGLSALLLCEIMLNILNYIALGMLMSLKAIFHVAAHSILWMLLLSLTIGLFPIFNITSLIPHQYLSKCYQ